jgi:hypothetical protein
MELGGTQTEAQIGRGGKGAKKLTRWRRRTPWSPQWNAVSDVGYAVMGALNSDRRRLFIWVREEKRRGGDQTQNGQPFRAAPRRGGRLW